MCNKKLIKIFSIILLLFFLLISVSNIVFADNFDTSQYVNAAGDPDVDKATKGLMGTAINVMRIVGTGIAIIMLSYMGIKYMMAAPAEKAEFKKSAAIYVLGAVLVFGASNILAFIAEVKLI